MKFFPGLQVLRAVAATLVLFQHAAYIADGSLPNTHSPYFGRVGVILFFAISGFVIALQRDKQIVDFASHRLLRIYPTFWVAVLIEAALLTSIGRQVLPTPSFILLYPSSSSNDFTSIPYWTLAFEMTFYALATAAFSCRLNERILTAIAVVWIGSVNAFGHDPSSVTEYGFPGSSILLSAPVQVFPMGVICAIHFKRFKKGGAPIYFLVAAVSFIACFWQQELSIRQLFLLGVACACTILITADYDLKLKLAISIGGTSYGIYLMHFPAMIFAAYFIPQLNLAVLFCVGLLAGVLFGLFDLWLYRQLRRLIRVPR